MSYGRASSNEELDPQVIQALANKMGLEVSEESAVVLTVLFMNQLAALESFSSFDLHEVVPAPIFSVEGKWDE